MPSPSNVSIEFVKSTFKPEFCRSETTSFIVIFLFKATVLFVPSVFIVTLAAPDKPNFSSVVSPVADSVAVVIRVTVWVEEVVVVTNTVTVWVSCVVVVVDTVVVRVSSTVVVVSMVVVISVLIVATVEKSPLNFKADFKPEDIPEMYAESVAAIRKVPFEKDAGTPACVSLAVTLPIVSEVEHVITVCVPSSVIVIYWVEETPRVESVVDSVAVVAVVDVMMVGVDIVEIGNSSIFL